MKVGVHACGQVQQGVPGGLWLVLLALALLTEGQIHHGRYPVWKQYCYSCGFPWFLRKMR